MLASLNIEYWISHPHPLRSYYILSEPHGSPWRRRTRARVTLVFAMDVGSVCLTAYRTKKTTFTVKKRRIQHSQQRRSHHWLVWSLHNSVLYIHSFGRRTRVSVWFGWWNIYIYIWVAVNSNRWEHSAVCQCTAWYIVVVSQLLQYPQTKK